SAQKIYTAKDRPKLKLLLRDDRLSEDLSLRFGNPSWSEHPLTAEKYVSWIRNSVQGDDSANLFLNYDVFGLRHPKESGIYDFLWHFPGEVLAQPGFQFQTPSESAGSRHAASALDVPEWTSEAEGRDLSTWKKNPMQESALEYLYSLEKPVLKSKDAALIHQWRKLQSSDYFQAMLGGGNADMLGFPTPYDAYVGFVNILNDFKEQLQ
ncbi:MAG: alpha-amylase, partial [Spirochaetia bacterium]|nr:alpha-amylase [Spirochaetia bacterium]